MALVVDSDQHAIKAFHLELTRVNEAQSRIEQFGMKKKYIFVFANTDIEALMADV